MRHITPYQENFEAKSLFTKYFASSEPCFSSILTLENIQWEADLLNQEESVIPEQLSFDLHFDMIVNEGAKAVSQYYQKLLSGKNEILESAKKKLAGSKLNESSVHFSKEAKERISKILTEGQFAFTPDQILANATGGNSTESEFSTALAGGEAAPSSGSDTMGLLKNLFDSITEGGSAIGILHLVLDILGVIGDAFLVVGIPAGAIFDIINAIIYFFRGKWLLGTISLIAGLLFGAGDILKAFKPVAKPMETVMMATAKGGSKAGAEELAKVSAKEQSLVVKGLQFIAKNISGVVGKAMSFFAKFIDSFVAKLVGWIPFIGKPLKGFLESCSGVLAKYADNMVNFSKGFTKVEKEAVELSIKGANQSIEQMLKAGGKMEIDAATGMVKVTDKSGKVISEFSQEVLTNPQILSKKAPKFFDDVKPTQYYNAVSSSNVKIADSVSKYFKVGLKGIKSTTRLAAFIGKQIIKIISGADYQQLGYTETETEYWGNAALQDWINKRIEKQKEETGAKYVPAVMLDSSDEEVFEHITNYQNHYAKMLGQPQIVPVIYEKYGNTEEEFEDFWKEVAKDSGEKEKETNESVSLKYVIPYSKF